MVCEVGFLPLWSRVRYLGEVYRLESRDDYSVHAFRYGLFGQRVEVDIPLHVDVRLIERGWGD